jgi:RHS repeat-associated protein
VGRVQYDPYGEVLTSTLPVTLTDRLFTGARFDGTIGLYHMGARWYDPALGRWIQADTIVPNPTNPQDLNRYTYVRNNPLRYTDPSGHYVLLEDETGAYTEFSVRILSSGEIRILSGGRWFRNYVEVAIANYELSGRRRALPEIGGAFGQTVRGPIINALTGLGYRSSDTSGVAEVWMDPLLVVGLAQLAGKATEDAAGAAAQALGSTIGQRIGGAEQIPDDAFVSIQGAEFRQDNVTKGLRSDVMSSKKIWLGKWRDFKNVMVSEADYRFKIEGRWGAADQAGGLDVYVITRPGFKPTYAGDPRPPGSGTAQWTYEGTIGPQDFQIFHIK